jgi:hypothetical protein
VSDLPVDDRQHRDVAVAVGSSGRDDPALRGVLENDNSGDLVVMYGQVVAAIENDRGAVGAIQLGYGLAPCDTPRVARNRDDVLEDDVLG